MSETERWVRVRDLLNAVLERPAEDRARFLADACADDPTLRAEVEGLLAAHESEPAFMETPLVDLGGRTGPEGPPDSDTRVGPYRLIRPLGRGGMGEVHLALREGPDFTRHVALKVIRRGLDTQDVMARFRAERRILASLRHPCIAGLVDGGTTDDGRPYFAMEYIEGRPLDTYCDQQRLSVPARLDLFRRVCEAVHHAHQNLVIHRDLKPSNILVTDDGTPKLLDFGIATLLEDTGRERTRPAERVLTPDYASPEHRAGAPVTTASDVFSLGVILYRLLTGQLPNPTTDSSGPPHPWGPVVRPSDVVTRRGAGATSEQGTDAGSAGPPESPTRLRRALSGDLDTIVLRALSEDPARRYASAQALADDLERFREGRPILARPDTIAYRLRTFTRRHAFGVAAGVAFLILLLSATTLSLLQSRRIVSEAARVRAERDKALEVRGFLVEMFGTTGASQAAGDSVTAGALLDLTTASLNAEYGTDPAILAEMQEVLAEGYRRMGRLETADSLARESLVLRERELGAAHPDVAAALNTLGLVLRDRGRPEEAEPLLRRAVALRRGEGSDRLDDLARALNDLGLVLSDQARLEEAGVAYEESLSIRRLARPGAHRGLAVTTSNLAALRYAQGNYEEAVLLGAEALEALRSTVGPDHRRSLIAQQNLAVMREVAGDREGAAEEYLDILDRRRRVLGPTHPDLVRSHHALTSTLLSAGRPMEAEEHARAALAIVRANPAESRDPAAESESLSWLARTVRQQGGPEEALSLQLEAVAILERAHPGGHPDVAREVNLVAQTLRSLGRFTDARAQHRRAIATAERFLGEGHSATLLYVSGLGQTLIQAGSPGAAAVHLQRAAEGLEEVLGADHQVVFTNLLLLARALGEDGQNIRADSVLAEAEARIPEGAAGQARAEQLLRIRDRLADDGSPEP